MEIHARFGGAFNDRAYQNCRTYCQTGEIRCMVVEDVVELSAGDMIAFPTADARWMEPGTPLGADEPAPLLLWIGEVRLKKA